MLLLQHNWRCGASLQRRRLRPLPACRMRCVDARSWCMHQDKQKWSAVWCHMPRTCLWINIGFLRRWAESFGRNAGPCSRLRSFNQNLVASFIVALQRCIWSTCTWIYSDRGVLSYSMLHLRSLLLRALRGRFERVEEIVSLTQLHHDARRIQ